MLSFRSIGPIGVIMKFVLIQDYFIAYHNKYFNQCKKNCSKGCLFVFIEKQSSFQKAVEVKRFNMSL